MRKLFLVPLLALIISCGGNAVIPDVEPGLKGIDQVPSWEITVDGVDYEFSIACLMTVDRRGQGVDPGTDMTPDELRVYFANEMTMASFPEFWWCPVYKYFKAALDNESDFIMNFLVYIMELNGFDVPNRPAPVPIC